jgi:cytochrome c
MRQQSSMTCSRGAFAALATVLSMIAFADCPANAAGDARRGEKLYKDCQACHSIEKNDIGPMHKGVIGRTAGTVAGYDYSPALRNAKITWTEDNLDKWLTNPQDFIPENKMFYEVENPQDRADLIAFLRERAR